jgi:ubiquinone/menaquinone biosynthesis C-methylase UbiE
VEVRGIDPDVESVAALSREGLQVEVGRAERLPYPDTSFDIVVFSFTAHHIADWEKAALEAMRVAKAIFILDPWYDVTFPSQVVAEKFDRWCKSIDRAGGMVHHDCMSVQALLGPIKEHLDGHQVRIEYMLELQDMGVARMLDIAARQLTNAGDASQWRPGLDALVAEAQLHGFSDDGAILLSIGRADAGQDQEA